MDTTYFLRGKNTPTEIVFKYDLNGLLKSFENPGPPLVEAQWQWLFHPDRMPYTEDRMQLLATNTFLRQKFTITKLPASVTFEDFWNAYGKIGTKSVAKRKFDKLKPEEVIKAFIGIEKEKSKKRLDNTAMPYAETYLNQKRWE